MSVVIETTLGDITVDLYLEQRPITCLNFLKLCKMKYYNFNLFHTIRSGFIAQTGDPSGEGSGGESIFGLLEGSEKRFFSGEKMPKIRHTDTGLISMVCTGDMMVGSQFYFTLGPDLDSLDGTHCIIGEVTEGHEVLRKLNDVICDETHRPYQDVRITHTVVLEDPYNDPAGLRAPSRSPSPSPHRLRGGRIAPDEEIDETQGKSAAEVQEIIEEKEAKARATILEIVGDIPDADIAPPENVLFVCKLNPVTCDEDLEIIFSRFGKIVSCEVIRDKKTGDSLQYAFIEFDDKKSCEDAYFKMDNVLIDDRRIHVDFSQSVSKIKWLGKGRGVKHITDDDNDSKGKQWNKDNFKHPRNQDRGDKSDSRDNNGREQDRYKERKESDRGEKDRHGDNEGYNKRGREKNDDMRERDTYSGSRESNKRDRELGKYGRENTRKEKDKYIENRDNNKRTREKNNTGKESTRGGNEKYSDSRGDNKKEREKDSNSREISGRDREKYIDNKDLNKRDRERNHDSRNYDKESIHERGRPSDKQREQDKRQRPDKRDHKESRERSRSRSKLDDTRDESRNGVNLHYKNSRSFEKPNNNHRTYNNSNAGEKHSSHGYKTSPTRNENLELARTSSRKHADHSPKRDHSEKKSRKEKNHDKSSHGSKGHRNVEEKSNKRKIASEDLDRKQEKKSKSSKRVEPRTPSPVDRKKKKNGSKETKKDNKTKSKRNIKKKRKHSTSSSDSDSSDSSSSSSESSSSSDSNRKKKVRRKRKYSSTSSSSDSSDSSTSSSTSSSDSSSSDSEPDKEKKKKLKEKVKKSKK